jgi:hypothetical protein
MKNGSAKAARFESKSVIRARAPHFACPVELVISEIGGKWKASNRFKHPPSFKTRFVEAFVRRALWNPRDFGHRPDQMGSQCHHMRKASECFWITGR